MIGFGNGGALEDADKEGRDVVTDYEDGCEGCGNAGCSNEAGVCFFEEGMIDETDGEFGGQGGQFEEDLVEPQELERIQSLVGAFV